MHEMNELPEIDFEQQDKDKKKRGFIPWLKQKLGIGSRGPVGAAGSSGGGLATGAGAGGRMAAGAGRGIGTEFLGAGRTAGIGGRFFGAAGTGGRFFGAAGSKGFLGGLIAGKAGTYLAAGLIATGLGIGAFMAMQGSMENDSPSFDFDKSSGSYIPQILRGQQDASSLDLLKTANEGFLGTGAEGGKEGEEKGEGEGAEGEGAGDNGMYEGAGASGEGFDAGGGGDSGASSRLADAGYGKLSSSLNSKFSSVGGFGNKFGQGIFGPKINSKFKTFGTGKRNISDSRIGKSFAMKGGSKRPVFTKGGKFGSSNKYGATPSMQKAYGVRDTQRSFTSGSIDVARGTQDRAWAGGETRPGGIGASVGGIGTGSGGGSDVPPTVGGIDTGRPDIDTPVTTEPTFDDPEIETPPPMKPETPEVEIKAQNAMKNILIAGMIAIVVAMLVKKAQALMTNPYTVTAGIILWGIAIAMAVAAFFMYVIPAISDAIEIMSKWKQPLMGSVYLLGAIAAGGALTMAMTGQTLGPITAVWAGVAAGALALLGSMLTSTMMNLPDINSSTTQQDTQDKDSSTGDDTSEKGRGESEEQQKEKTLNEEYPEDNE